MKQFMVDRARRPRVAAGASLALSLAAAGVGCHADPGASGPTSPARPVTTATTPGTAAAPAPAVGPATGAPIPVPPSSAAATTTQPGAGPEAGVHFTTPQAAMRYLTAAYNRDDIPALRNHPHPP